LAFVTFTIAAASVLPIIVEKPMVDPNSVDVIIDEPYRVE